MFEIAPEKRACVIAGSSQCLVETACEGMLATELELRITYVNSRFSHMLGYSPGELVGLHLIDLLHEGDRRAVLQRLQDGTHGVGSSGRVRYLHKDGKTVVNALVSRAPLRDWEGHVTGVLVVATDISELVHTEEALNRSRHQLAEAQRIGHMGNLARNIKTGELIISEECRRILGLDPESPFDLSIYLDKFIHVDDRDDVEAKIKKAITEGGGYRADYRVTTPGGVERAIHAEGEVTRDSDGTPIELFGTIQDVTEGEHKRKEIEHLLDLARVARDEAERANRAKDLFLATISHELRTPLSAILLWTDMIRSGRTDTERTKKGLEVIDRNVRQEVQLIEDLLDVSRIVAGKLLIEPQLVSVNELIDGVIETLSAATATKALHIIASSCPDDTVLNVFADPMRLRQVLWNLLGNAIKFSNEGGTIGISLRKLDDVCTIAVSDNGVGIEPEFLPHIFDRFSQEDLTSTRRFGGLGLGLAISDNLVRMMGGTLRAESRGKGHGATFTVTLPISIGATPSTAPFAATAGVMKSSVLPPAAR